MGHVSDFNGMDACDEADLSQATSDLINVDNVLDSLNENFMPIYNSFPEDIYRHPNLYASNLSSFINTDDARLDGYFDEPIELAVFLGYDFDSPTAILENELPILQNDLIYDFNSDDRNGYFDEPIELDLLLDFDFDSPTPILENEQPILQNDSVNDFNSEVSTEERNGNIATFQQEKKPEVSDLQTETVSCSDANAQGSHCYSDNSETTGPSEPKTYTAETIFKSSESSNEKTEEIPKIIIKLKPETKCKEEDFITAEASAPMTIADCVKLGRRRNGNLKGDDSGQTVANNVNKRKTHKKKSRHKKRHSVGETKSKTADTNQNFSMKSPNCRTTSFAGECTFVNQNAALNMGVEGSKTFDSGFSEFRNDSNCQVTNHTIICFKKSSPSVDRNLDSYNSDHVLSDLKTSSTDNETPDEAENEPSATAGDSFEFNFGNADDSMSLPSPVDVEKGLDSPVESFLEHINDTPDHRNIPDSDKSSQEEETESVDVGENSSSNVTQKEELNGTPQTEDSVANCESNKSTSVSDLIEELNAHNQQVFEEIEISTPELELEFKSDEKNSTNLCLETSHQSENSANDSVAVQNKTVVKEHGENDMNSQNHLSVTKTPPQTVSVLTHNHSSSARPRKISSSGSSIISKSSSHRSYRKRRRSSSSSSSSSDRERFYNRPVKYDPVTHTYCDEFGREIRPSELKKYYLHSKSRHRDSHSNNGSSSSSRSKSPRYRSYHRKHHKSRSGSRSHRRRRYSSSRSRSRSRERRYKADSDRKYRSPSPKHQGKRHYLDDVENMRAYEERRVMYVGDIPPGYTVDELKERFSRFGPIQSASIKSKNTADGSLYIFGFVTFKNRSDVCQAIERGNENPSWPRFDLNFGGRRRFCNGNYTDLDGKVAEAESGWYGHQSMYRPQPARQEDDFAELLRQEQRRLGMAKK